jgi:hypothetical protein
MIALAELATKIDKEYSVEVQYDASTIAKDAREHLQHDEDTSTTEPCIR